MRHDPLPTRFQLKTPLKGDDHSYQRLKGSPLSLIRGFHNFHFPACGLDLLWLAWGITQRWWSRSIMPWCAGWDCRRAQRGCLTMTMHQDWLTTDKMGESIISVTNTVMIHHHLCHHHQNEETAAEVTSEGWFPEIFTHFVYGAWPMVTVLLRWY